MNSNMQLFNKGNTQFLEKDLCAASKCVKCKINVNEVAYDMYQVCPRDFNDDSLIYSKQQKQDEATNRTSREDSCDKRTIDTGISA